MSKKSTARTGSEGDAESPFTDVFANIRSGSSTCNSKAELEGGPFGDSPCEKAQHIFKDYFILMFQDDDTTTTEASEGSDVDEELYNLQNDYLDKLNIVRRTLNLLELSDEVEGRSPNTCNNRCIITEIEDQNTSSAESTENNQADHETNTKENKDDLRKLEIKQSAHEEFANTKNIIRIFPSTNVYNFDSVSTTNIFELDYNPPKKKLCYRQKTPNLKSVSEGNLPYYTRVGLHDDLFSQGDTLEKGRNLILGKDNKFTECKETQYTVDDFSNLSTTSKKEVVIFRQIENINLFPEVIIQYKTNNASESSSVSSQASINSKPVSNQSNSEKTAATEEPMENNLLSLNLVDERSDDSFTTTTYSTIIESPQPKKKVKKRFGGRNKISSSEKLTLWEEIRKLHSLRNSTIEMENKKENASTLQAESKDDISDDNIRSKKESGAYIRQYIRYKKQMDQIKSYNVPFGNAVFGKHSEFKRSVEYFCYSDSSSVSNDFKKKIVITEENSRNRKRHFFGKSFLCCWSKRS